MRIEQSNQYTQSFVSKNRVYFIMSSKGKDRVWVYDKKDLKIINGEYVIDKTKCEPDRKISFNQFRAEAVRHQQNSIIKGIAARDELTYEEARKKYNKQRENIKEARIADIAIQHNFTKADAVKYYNFLVKNKKFSELQKYGTTDEIEIHYRF